RQPCAGRCVVMRAWCRILPLFAVCWLSRRYSERFHVAGVGACTNPYPDVLIRVDPKVADE
ncbi:MAG: hypothetical protein ACREVZ_13630, partial [Burkholderiales bacterium]